MNLKEEKRAKVRGLIKLSLDKTTTLMERNSAAMRAVKLIRKYDLLEPSKLDGVLENDTVKSIKTVVDAVATPEVTGALKMLGKVIGNGVEQARRRR